MPKTRDEIKARLKRAEDKLKRIEGMKENYGSIGWVAEYAYTKGEVETLKWILGE